jgi:hypothetical protein
VPLPPKDFPFDQHQEARPEDDVSGHQSNEDRNTWAAELMTELKDRNADRNRQICFGVEERRDRLTPDDLILELPRFGGRLIAWDSVLGPGAVAPGGVRGGAPPSLSIRWYGFRQLPASFRS